MSLGFPENPPEVNDVRVCRETKAPAPLQAVGVTECLTDYFGLSNAIKSVISQGEMLI